MKKSLLIFIASTFLAVNSYSQWNLTGNAGTGTSFLGTTNNFSLRMRTNNVQRMIIDSIGRIGIGIAAPRQLLTVQSSGTVPAASWISSGAPVYAGYGEGTPGNADFNLLMASSTAANARGVMGMKRSRGTLAVPAAVVNNDQLGSLLVSGFDGTNFQGAAAVDFFADGTPTAGNVPVRISFVTGSNGGNRAERLRIGSNGDINITTGNIIAARKAVIKGIAGINGDTLSGTALYVNAGATINGIRVKDPVDNYVLYAEKSGENNGVYISSSTTTSGSGAIAGVATGTATGVEAYGSLNNGLYAQSDSAAAVYAFSNTSFGVYGESGDAASYAGYFNGDVFSTGSFTSSDARLKNNIKDFGNAMQLLNALQPRSYDFKQEGQYASLHLPPGNHYGLIAQDLEKVLPNLVKESSVYIKDKTLRPGKDNVFSKGRLVSFKAVNYTELIPVMLKGMQELSKDNEELKIKNEELKAVNEAMEARLERVEKMLNIATTSKQQNISLYSGSLEQNVPNPPVNNNTRISYNIPGSSTKSELVITDVYGKKLKQISLTNKGKSTLNVDTTGLAAGNYSYTLLVDGKVIETKKMVVMAN